MIPIDLAKSTYSHLREQGFEFETVSESNLDHGLSMEEIGVISTFFKSAML